MIWKVILLNTANKLTMLRLILIPVFVVFSLLGRVWCDYVALAVFLIASLTDLADGQIARKYDMITDFGKFSDPLADKLLVAAALCVLVSKGLSSVWVLFFVIVREFIVTGIRLIASGRGKVIAASMWGKVKTVIQLVIVSVALLPLDILTAPALLNRSATWWAMWVLAAVTLVSGYDYIIKNTDIFKDIK